MNIKRIFTFVVILVVIGAFVYTILPPRVNIQSNNFQIKGLYGVQVTFDEIDNIKIKDNIPSILRRVNGMNGFGISSRGKFKLEELGKGKLFLQSRSSGPYLMINYGNDNFIVINYRDKIKTRELYNQLTNKMK